MRIRIKGEAPRPPFFLSRNHVATLTSLPSFRHLECTFVAKNTLPPGRGWMLASGVDTISLPKKFPGHPARHPVNQRKFGRRPGVGAFSRRTSTMGDKIMPFSPALLEPAARAGYPVSYAAIVTVRRPTSRLRTPPCVGWGEMDFVPHFLKLLLVSKIEATVVYGEDAIQADDRKLLARSLWSAVNEQSPRSLRTGSAKPVPRAVAIHIHNITTQPWERSPSRLRDWKMNSSPGKLRLWCALALRLVAVYLLVVLVAHIVRWWQPPNNLPIDKPPSECCEQMVPAINGEHTLDRKIRFAYEDRGKICGWLTSHRLDSRQPWCTQRILERLAPLLESSHRLIITDLPGLVSPRATFPIIRSERTLVTSSNCWMR